MKTEYCFKKINDNYFVLKKTTHIKDDWVEIDKEEKNMSKEELLEELGMSEIELNNLNKLERYYSEEELGFDDDEYREEEELIDEIEEWFKKGNEIDYIIIDIEKFVDNKEAIEKFLNDTGKGQDAFNIINRLRKQYGYKEYQALIEP
nr:MAG TPA: hypothetical protein [Caudoviricetes sp.]